MSARDDAIRIMQQHRPMDTIPGECLCGWSDGTGQEIAALGHVIDAIEPIIRANERKRLREQVKALPTHGSLPVCGDGPVVFLDAVLELLGGESDD